MSDLDDNKSALTHRVTAVAAAYLDRLGCKPIETEVPVRVGWVADVASYWYPTMSEAKRLDLDKRAAALFGPDCDTPAWWVTSRAYGDGPFTVLVEVKTTRQDFLQDKKWDSRDWPAHVCCLAYPTEVVRDGELPKGWYGLEISKEGRCLRKVHRPFAEPHPQHQGLVLDFVAAVGIRRDHRTRHAAMRDWAKAFRASDQERKVRYSASRLLRNLADWMHGEGWDPERSLVDALANCGLRKPSSSDREVITFFESLRPTLTEPRDD